MVAQDFCLCRVDVRRRLKSRPRRPEKIRGLACHARIVMQDNEWPPGENSFTRQTLGLSRVFRIRHSLNDEAAAAEHFRPSDIARQFPSELARQLAHSITQTKQDGLTSFVPLAARVVKRVHRNVGEDEKIALETRARQDMLEQLAEILQILRRVRQDEKLRQRELAFA